MVQFGGLTGNIYHMTHVDNLQRIFQQGVLLSKERLEQQGLSSRSIANEDVQNRRDRIFIWDFVQQHYRRLHTYVPFYFGTHSSMMYVQRNNGMLSQIVLLEVSRTILQEQGVLFTDGNVTNQQLSNYSELVYIRPAVENNSCTRQYSPKPYGTNQNCSNVYDDIRFLQSLDWDAIHMKRSIADFNESKRIRSAEVLIPDSLPLEKVRRVTANTSRLAKTVHAIMNNCQINGISIACKPNLFPL